MARPRIVIVGAGFAGYQTARTLSRLVRHKADITVLNPTDYFLYLPLLPQVAAGLLEPRRVAVSLSGTLPQVRLVLGEAHSVDLDGHAVHYTDPEGGDGTLPYDRLVLAVGSVNKLLPIPGVAEHAHGFRGLPEALYLRDHVTRQVELAAAADDPAGCAARCTFVVVGAGYTGTEVAAQGQRYTEAQVRKHPLRHGMRPRWLLLDIAPRVLPELDERLSRTADRVLRQRGVEVRMGTSVKEATHDGVLLTDGEFVDTRTLVWCVGVRPDPLVESIGQPLERGRLLVDPHLQLPGHPEVFACGDAAAVPDPNSPGKYTPMTAQHAWRHGKVAARNVAASLGVGERRVYGHRDLGFVVDLGGAKAAANPFGVHLPDVLAGAVTRGYHLAAMPGNRVRVAADWLLDAVLPRQGVQLGLVRSWSVPLDTASPELARVPDDTDRPAGPTDDDAPAASAPAERGTGTASGKRPSGAEPAAGSAPDAEAVKDRPGDASAGSRTGGDTAAKQTGGRSARQRPGGRGAKKRAGAGAAGKPAHAEATSNPASAAAPATKPPGGEAAKNQPGGEPAKNQPGGEPARNQSAGEPARNQPGGEAGENQPGGERAKKQPGGDAATKPPGGEAAKNQPGGEPAKNQPGGEAAKKQPGGEAAKKQPGGEAAKKQPGGEAAKKQPGGEAAKKQPGGEAAKTQSGGAAVESGGGGASAEPPGPVKRTDTPAEGDR
ncbi:FAD-dependent oxidoreductase [Streptomyces sediminimaris]|uniref:FAD-dependent oxidoreductase n=1 Tax=Streptomyces sediminimaris TaxID=3383721 RepID=UPI003999F56D